MRHSVGYVLSKTQAIIEFDKEQFELAIENREEKYEYKQTFEDNNILEYNTIVLHVTTEAGFNRVEAVREIYGIVPNEKRVYKGEADYVFTLQKPVTQVGATRIAKILEDVFMSSVRFFMFYKPEHIEPMSDKFLNVGYIQQVGVWLANSRKVAINDVKNHDALMAASLMDAEQVVKKLKRREKVDNTLGVIVGYGGVVDYVLATLRSIDATYKFFSEYFEIAFEDAFESMESYMSEGVGVNGDGIVISGCSMQIIDEKGRAQDLADFIITVHYKVRRKAGISYIVSLIKNDAEVKHVEWPMTLSEQKVCEFVSSFGPFHINPNKINIMRLHEMISSTRVPDITVYYKYGRAKYGDDEFMLYKDFAYNLTKGVAIPKLTGTPFYFIDGINGIKVEGRDGTDIDTMLVDKAPSLGHSSVYNFEDFYTPLKNVFKDYSAEMILMSACTWMGHAMFEKQYSCPLFFTTGITGSGKTTYAKYLCSMFGIKKPMSIEGTTPFPLRVSLTLMDKLPLFLNEFRTKMSHATEKTAILKSLFDGTAYERGRQNLTLESFTFSAYVFMEGEELPESGAGRSRSIIWKIKKSGQGTVSAERNLEQHREVLGSFCYSYLQTASRDEYLKAIDEGHDIFYKKGIDVRILTNIILMYAGSCAFAPEQKGLFRAVCEQVLENQLEDLNRNGTIAEIINIIGKYLTYRYANVYIDGYTFVLSWNDIVEFCEKSRITTELKLNSYRDHVESFGIETGFMEVRDDGDGIGRGRELMVDGLRIQIANIDKRFLGNPQVYSLYKKYIALGKQ